MTIYWISLLSCAIFSVTPVIASQPSKKLVPHTNSFVNDGAIYNQGHMAHFGSFHNRGIIVNGPTASFQTGRIPQHQPTPDHYHSYTQQSVNPYHQQQYQPQYQSQRGSFYYNQKKTSNLRAQHVAQAAEHTRPLTAEQLNNITTMDAFAQVSEYLPKKFERSLKNSVGMQQAEKSLVAEMLVPRMKADPEVQDLEKVMHVFSGNKEESLLLTTSSKKTTDDQPLFFFNKDKESLFYATAQSAFETTKKSPRKLFYSRTNNDSHQATTVCNQLQLNKKQSNPMHEAVFGKEAR